MRHKSSSPLCCLLHSLSHDVHRKSRFSRTTGRALASSSPSLSLYALHRLLTWGKQQAVDCGHGGRGPLAPKFRHTAGPEVPTSATSRLQVQVPRPSAPVLTANKRHMLGPTGLLHAADSPLRGRRSSGDAPLHLARIDAGVHSLASYLIRSHPAPRAKTGLARITAETQGW